jgi:hypothetical protein
VNFFVLEEVEAEVQEEREYYNREDEGLGERFVDEVLSTYRVIQSWPDVFKKLRGGYRQVGVKVFPHAVIFRVYKGDMYVVAVAPYRKRPYYWRHRKLA